MSNKVHSKLPSKVCPIWEALLLLEDAPPELPSIFNEDVEQFHTVDTTESEKAGIDAGTDSFTFMEMNGRNVFITGVDNAAHEVTT